MCRALNGDAWHHSKLRGCDLVALKVRDVCHGDAVASRAVVMQHKTQRPVQFEITPVNSIWGRPMSTARVLVLLNAAVAADPLAADGRYTSPRSWGVYKINPPTASATRLHRIGNHPVRHTELEREFGRLEVLGLFTSRAMADELSRLLNDGTPAE